MNVSQLCGPSSSSIHSLLSPPASRSGPPLLYVARPSMTMRRSVMSDSFMGCSTRPIIPPESLLSLPPIPGLVGTDRLRSFIERTPPYDTDYRYVLPPLHTTIPQPSRPDKPTTTTSIATEEPSLTQVCSLFPATAALRSLPY